MNQESTPAAEGENKEPAKGGPTVQIPTARLPRLFESAAVAFVALLCVIVGALSRFDTGAVFNQLKLGQYIEQRGEVPMVHPYSVASQVLPTGAGVWTSHGGSSPVGAWTSWKAYAAGGWAGVHAVVAAGWITAMLCACLVARLGLRFRGMALGAAIGVFSGGVLTSGGAAAQPLHILPMCVGALALCRPPTAVLSPSALVLAALGLTIALGGSVLALGIWLFAGFLLKSAYVRTVVICAPGMVALAGAALLSWMGQQGWLPMTGFVVWPRHPGAMSLVFGLVLGTVALACFRDQRAGLLMAGAWVALVGGWSFEQTTLLAAFAGAMAVESQSGKWGSLGNRGWLVTPMALGVVLAVALVFRAFDPGSLGIGPRSERFPEQAATLGERTGARGLLLCDPRDADYLAWRLWPEWTIVPVAQTAPPETVRELSSRAKAAYLRHDSSAALEFGKILSEQGGQTNPWRAAHLDQRGYMAFRSEAFGSGLLVPFRRLNPGVSWEAQTSANLTVEQWMEIGADIRSLTLDQPDNPVVRMLDRRFKSQAPPEAVIK